MKEKGFTLIELMIVIAIIGILAAIAAPIVRGERIEPGIRCTGGLKFDTESGRQLIGPNGGGVPCEPATSAPVARQGESK